jgi:acyl transferase domain-containing protein/acyl carrier protein
MRQIRQTVLFSQGLGELLQDPHRILLEVGPGRSLSAFVKSNAGQTSSPTVLSSLRNSVAKEADAVFLSKTIGRLWLSGAPFHWQSLHGAELRRRLSLPTYPFEGDRYWIEPRVETFAANLHKGISGKTPNVEDWFYLPSWKPSLSVKPSQHAQSRYEWIIFSDESELASALVEHLRGQHETVITVTKGTAFERKTEHHLVIDPAKADDYRALMAEVTEDSVCRIVHLWSLTRGRAGSSGSDSFKVCQTLGYYSVLLLSQAVAATGSKANITIVSDQIQAVDSNELACPEKQPIPAVCTVVSQESRNIAIRCIDIALNSSPISEKDLALQVLDEVMADSVETMVAYRGKKRFVQGFEPVRLNNSVRPVRALRANGVYLITGAFGGVGTLIAEHLAKTIPVKLVLTTRTPMPARDAWSIYLDQHPAEDRISGRIAKVRALEALGAEVMVAEVNVADVTRMKLVLARVESTFGSLDGVFHAAGVTSGASIYKPFADLGVLESEMQFEPKVYGVYALKEALEGRTPDFCLLFSSNAAILGGLGYLTYAAANRFMDAFSCGSSGSKTAWISANWDPWPTETKKYQGIQTNIDQYAMSKEEALDALTRTLNFIPSGQVVIATGDFEKRLRIWLDKSASDQNQPAFERPDLRTRYVPPSDDVENRIVKIWEHELGMHRVGIYDNFFDLGGHSLLVMRLISRLQDEFGVEVSINKVFEAPTIACMAELIRSGEGEEQTGERAAILAALARLSDEEVEIELKKRAVASKVLSGE